MFKSIKTKSKKAGAAIGTTIKVLTAVVCGALVMTGTYGVVKTAVLPTTTTKVESMFEYEGSGGSGGGSGGDSPIYSTKVNGQTADASAENYMPYYRIDSDGLLTFTGVNFSGDTVEVPDTLDGVAVTGLNTNFDLSHWDMYTCPNGCNGPAMPKFAFSSTECATCGATIISTGTSMITDKSLLSAETDGENVKITSWPTISRIPSSVDTFVSELTGDFLQQYKFTCDISYSDKSTAAISTTGDVRLVGTFKDYTDSYLTNVGPLVTCNNLKFSGEMYAPIHCPGVFEVSFDNGSIYFNGNFDELISSLKYSGDMSGARTFILSEPSDIYIFTGGDSPENPMPKFAEDSGYNYISNSCNLEGLTRDSNGFAKNITKVKLGQPTGGKYSLSSVSAE